MKNTLHKKVKGFTLVELIVVISIIGVLSAIIIPNLVSYVRKARLTAAISSARTIVTGTRTSAMDKSIYGTFSLTKSAVIDGKNVKVGGITNTSICGAIEKNDKISNTSDKALALSVYDILINADIEAGSKPTQKPWGLTGKEFLTKTTANYGLVIIYTSDGDIPFAQIYHNGILVTYAHGEYVANDSKDAKFIKLGQSFSDPFVQAGKNKSELNSKILNSKFPSNW